MFPLIFLRPLRGAHGRNWPGIAVIDPDAPHREAVAAQEIWEAGHKMNPVNLIPVLISRKARRRMEIMGHEVEVQAAALILGRDQTRYRAAEIAAMKRGYGGLFDAMSNRDLRMAMAARSAEARKWVRTNRARLMRMEP
ncbi:hypothetical protein [Paracoccus sp. (in: a-proteobacteria)]|uniref:hypothetical protein n=1 Tax=Paracoccus sp. TaxID=267 RepID=UPI003A8A2BE4